MASENKDTLMYLPASQAPPEKLSSTRVRKLVKLFKAHPDGEPKNTGVRKAVGSRMMKAAAKAAAKRRARR